MATSPLNVAPRPFAWDFSGVFSDIAQRGQIGVQLGASKASRSGTPGSSKSSDYERKGEAAWWAEEYRAEQEAKANLHGLLKEYGNDARGAMSDPRFMDNISAINQARSYAANEFRGQQFDKKKLFDTQYKDKRNELVVSDGQVSTLPGLNGKPATVEQYLDFGTYDPNGAAYSWNVDVTDGKGLEDSLEKSFSSLRFNENKEPQISTDSMSGDMGSIMNIFLNSSFGHKGNSDQMDAAIHEAANSIGQTRKNDILSWYSRTEDYKERSRKPVSEGGFMNGDNLDQNAVYDRILHGENILKEDGTPLLDDAGNNMQYSAGWWPDKLREMAQKHRWTSSSHTANLSSKTLTPVAKEMIGSQQFIDAFDGQLGFEGEGQRGYFIQNMGPGGLKARTDNRAGYFNRDATETNAVNKQLQYGDPKDGKGWRPLTENFDGATTIAGFMFQDSKRGEQNYFKPLLTNTKALASEPSNKIWHGTDVTRIPGDKPLTENDKVDHALYHTFKNGIAFPLDELSAMNPQIALPSSVDLNEVIEKSSNNDAVPQLSPRADYKMFRNIQVTIIDKPQKKSTTKTRVYPTDFGDLSKIGLDELINDRLDDYNKVYSTNLRVMTKEDMAKEGMPVDDFSPDDREYLVAPDAMVQFTNVSLRNVKMEPKTDVGRTLLSGAGGSINNLLNQSGTTQAPPSELEFFRQSIMTPQ